MRSDDVREGAWGTAPVARFWVALEQPGPWGRVAATESHLDPELGAELDRRISEAGGRLLLVRRPGHHPEDDRHHDPAHPHGPRTVMVAGCAPLREWILEGQVDDPRELLDLDLAAVAGDRPSVVQERFPALVRAPGPRLLVCTNGRRDVCCATRGRAVALEAAQQRPGQVWEASHTGGHRFAPTGVMLPHGIALGRLDVELAISALDAFQRNELPAMDLAKHYRGRSYYQPMAQAAEAAARYWPRTGQVREERLAYLAAGAVQQVDEHSWWVEVHRRDDDDPQRAWVQRVAPPGKQRPESCGKSVLQVLEWSVAVLDHPT